jgi:phthalate 4,5-cis-dihydrodiol dehydrogenase
MSAPVRLGVAGLGRAFTLMLPTFAADARVELAAAADPRPEAREQFAREFGAAAFATVEDLAAAPNIDAIYVATPHQYHAAHAIAAMRAGKHVLVEKPMAIAMEEAEAMIAAARETGMRLVVGPSHSFDAPVALARSLIRDDGLGEVRMITALNFTDYLYRFRRPEELDTRQGGGVLFSQAAHQVDIVRLLGGGRVKTVRAAAGAWDPSRPTEGAYAALLTFEGGAFASLAYSGYGHFDSDELCDWIGELGQEKDPAVYGAARRALASLAPADEAAAKSARNYGGSAPSLVDAHWHEHFGPLVDHPTACGSMATTSAASCRSTSPASRGRR